MLTITSEELGVAKAVESFLQTKDHRIVRLDINNSRAGEKIYRVKATIFGFLNPAEFEVTLVTGVLGNRIWRPNLLLKPN